MLREIENLVAEAVEVNIPFMNPITWVFILLFCADDLSVPLAVIVPSHTRPVSMPKPS